MAEVESFTLDHTQVKAPYVRLIEEQAGPAGGAIANYDLRLVQPNETSIETAGIHTLEHLFASLVRAVSYTHLRAHETDSYLVCRLLLEKKKKREKRRGIAPSG